MDAVSNGIWRFGKECGSDATEQHQFSLTGSLLYHYVQAKHGLNRQCIKSMVLFRLFLRGSSAAHIQGPNTKTTQACCIGKVGLAWHQLSGYTYIFPICKTSLLRNICKSPCYGKGVWDWKKRQKLNAGSENFCSSSTRFFQICSEVPGEMGTS